MLRFIFLLLLVICIGFATAIYLSDSRPPSEVLREINPGALKIISVTEGVKAQQEAAVRKRIVDSLSGSACIDFSIRPGDAARAQTAFAELQLGARLSARNIEEFTRFGVAITGQTDKKAADNLLANLKKAGVKDLSLLPDNTISLGVFSSEDAAKRYLAELEAKDASLLKGASITPRNPLVRETIYTVREPDANLVARLTIMQRDFDASLLKAVPCVAQQSAASATPPASTGPNTGK